jgi:hypothetical protein
LLPLVSAIGCMSDVFPRSGQGDDPAAESDADGAPPAGGDPADAATPPPDSPPGTQSTVFSADDIVDTYVRMSDPTLNYGASDRMCGDKTDGRMMLLRIDVSAIPVGAHVVGSDLRLWTDLAPSDASTQTYSSYPMLESWDEGEEDAAAGAASWNERDSDAEWTASGLGIGSRGADVVGSFIPVAPDTEYLMALEPSLIQGWIDDSGSNFGLVIVATGEDGACFDSTELADAAKRPSLVVRWTP